MTPLDAGLLFVAALLGGTLNAVAGGGSFFSFPALLFVGVPPILANATNTVALWPGSVASAAAYRRELSRHRGQLVPLAAASLMGGLLGALLLLRTKETTFALLIPYLLLLATVIFAASNSIVRRVRAFQAIHPISANSPGHARAVLVFAQFVIAIYGGFFGGGIGILMLAALALSGMEDMHEMNAWKTVLAALINGISVVTFAVAGIVRWPEAVVMIGGAVVGGYGAAAIARTIAPATVRRFVIAVGVTMTIYFFVK